MAGRVNIDEIHINENHTIGLTVSRRFDIEDLDAAVEKEHVKALKTRIMEAAVGHQWEAFARHFVA